MSKLPKPVNDWAKALFILYHNNMAGVSMAKVLTEYDHTFYKFQTRLGEVMEDNPDLKVLKTTIPYKSKLNGKSKHYMQYTPLSSKKFLLELYEKINK